MSESTTSDAVPVRGEPHEHPAIRRLARACIALARWQRQQHPDDEQLAPPPAAEPSS